MLRFPEIVERPVTNSRSKDGEDGAMEDDEEEKIEKVYANDADRELALKKIRALMRIIQSKGTERVVLGAWGCGAYGNPVDEIVALWKKVLFGKLRKGKGKNQDFSNSSPGSEWAPLSEIVFAIKDRKMAENFAAAWGDDIRVEYGEKKLKMASTLGNEEDERNLEELQDKIRELELQITQVKTPLLKQGLESTLQTLRAQLNELESSHSATEDASDEVASGTGLSDEEDEKA